MYIISLGEKNFGDIFFATSKIVFHVWKQFSAQPFLSKNQLFDQKIIKKIFFVQIFFSKILFWEKKNFEKKIV